MKTKRPLRHDRHPEILLRRAHHDRPTITGLQDIWQDVRRAQPVECEIRMLLQRDCGPSLGIRAGRGFLRRVMGTGERVCGGCGGMSLTALAADKGALSGADA
jgi:hypothetical protein